MLRTALLRNLREIEMKEVLHEEWLGLLDVYASQRLWMADEADVIEDGLQGIISLAVGHVLDAQSATMIYKS